MQQHKYARVERERRFLLRHFPSDRNVVRIRRIIDRYIDGTALRLRKQSGDDGSVVFKLTQKIPERSTGAQQGLITTLYLTEKEYQVVAQLPAQVLTKTRHSVPPFGIDIFDGPLTGLLLAEAEFESEESAVALEIPAFIHCEVSGDDRFTGGQLVRATEQDLRTWLSEYGLGVRSLGKAIRPN